MNMRLWGLAGLWMAACSVWALDTTSGVTVQPLAQAQSTWDGKALAYPEGRAEVTAMQVEIALGAETGWHQHSVPSFAYMLQGELEITLKDGTVNRLKAGDAVFEVVGTTHNGRNVGDVPVKLVVFYAGAAGKALSMPVKP
ncbi:MAG: cupin domain-containing protein [Zoogloeaceae bacterium]|nr:cupin domain-containing protein [Zoogloeaceae bacterium]